MKRLLVCLLLVGVVGCGESESYTAIKAELRAMSEYNKGTDFAGRKDWAAAIACYTEAIRMDPDFAWAYGSRGVAYRHLEEYDKAIADYTAAIRINPDDADAYNNRGVAHRELGNDVKAAADFAKAKKLGYGPEDE